MNFKEYLQSLEWNSFSNYPAQGENIFLHCASTDGKTHRFLKVTNFNAVFFNPYDLNKNVKPSQRWLYSWLPADEINYNND